MSYKEQLEKAKKYGINPISLDVAYEVQCVFEIEYTLKEFEMCCSFIEKCYLKSDYSSIWAITKALYDLIIDKNNAQSIVELIENMSFGDLIEKASWYD